VSQTKAEIGEGIGSVTQDYRLIQLQMEGLVG
jgi:hypothetical protein